MDEMAFVGIMFFGAICGILEVVFYFGFAYVIIKAIVKAFKKSDNNKYFKNNVVDNYKKNKYTDISKRKLSEFNTDDLDAFKDYFYKMFYNFEKACNDVDYNMMKNLSTKQLYNNYYTGISLDLSSGKKRIISNIKREDVIIYEVYSSNQKQVVNAMIEVSYISYMIDKSGLIIKGDRDKKVTEKFEVTFRKDFINDSIKKCPNCGASVTGSKCEFCKTNFKNDEFKISDIKKIIE